MHRQFKSAAIFQLLDKITYENVLIINGWQAMNSIIACHSNKIVHITNRDLPSDYEAITKDFDLVVAFSPNLKTLDYINQCNINSKIEILIVHCASWTYGWRDAYQYRELAGISGEQRSTEINYQKTIKYFSLCKSLVYFPFPNIIEPELILPKFGFKNYRRYWSWSQFPKERSFVSILGEYIFIRILKSSFFCPFSVVKIN